MINYDLRIPSEKIKTHFGTGIVTRGYAWLENRYLNEASLAELVVKQNTPKEFLNTLRNLNGCYSILYETEEYVFLASDKFGTYPLYYAKSGNDIFISDSVSYIVEKTGISKINKNAEMDITYTGYIYKDETMLSGIYQVIASEYAVISKSDMKLTKDYHFRFEFDKNIIIDDETAIAAFDNVCRNVADRLVKSLNGRKCVLFLSGGVDSRFCAYLLKLAGYEDKTLLLTYGSKLSPDYRAAVKTAKFLGMEHVFIPYKRKDWAGTYIEPESLEYIRYAQNLTISAHLREHFVVREILEKGIASTKDIIVPGHLGTVAGREYTREQFRNIDTTHTRLVNQTAIFYNMHKLESAREYLFKRTRDLFPKTCRETDPLFYLNMYNNAAFTTYSIKYLVNSLRAYDFYGFEWRLPLLDSEMLGFFNRLKFDSLVCKKFFKTYVSDKIPVPYSKFSVNFIRKVFRNLLDARYACIKLSRIVTMKNDYNGNLPVLTRAYRYIRNFSTYCSVYEIEMMEKEIKNITSK